MLSLFPAASTHLFISSFEEVGEVRNRFSYFISVALIFCFVTFLVTAMVVTLWREKETYSFYDNRILAQMPEATKETVVNGQYFTDIDTFLREQSAGRTLVLKLKTFIDMHILNRVVINDVVVSDDALLAFKGFETVDEEKLRGYANSAAEKASLRAQQVEEYGGEYYFISIPCQYVCYEDSYPWYMNNRAQATDITSAAMLESMKAYGVNYIDMMNWYIQAGRPEYFSSCVDNHFGIEGAYYTYLQLMERIIEDTDFEPDVLQDGEFSIVQVENNYMGSRLRKCFGLWPCDEKLSILLPDKDVPFRRWNNGREVEPTVYSLPQYEWNDATYNIYMGGDIASTVIDTQREDLPSILIYGDSFTNAIESIVWYSFDTMYSLDFRHYTEKTLDDFINEIKPDIVVCVRDYEIMVYSGGNGQ